MGCGWGGGSAIAGIISYSTFCGMHCGNSIQITKWKHIMTVFLTNTWPFDTWTRTPKKSRHWDTIFSQEPKHHLITYDIISLLLSCSDCHGLWQGTCFSIEFVSVFFPAVEGSSVSKEYHVRSAGRQHTQRSSLDTKLWEMLVHASKTLFLPFCSNQTALRRQRLGLTYVNDLFQVEDRFAPSAEVWLKYGRTEKLWILTEQFIEHNCFKEKPNGKHYLA